MKTNDQYYDSAALREIAELTNTLCNLPVKSFRRSKNAECYWSKMMKKWKLHVNTIGYNVVYAALYCIYWGIYPKDLPVKLDLIRLVDLLKEEFLKVNADMEHAKNKQFFCSSLTKVLKSKSPHGSTKKWKAEVYVQFLEAKMMYKLYGGEIEVKINLLSTSVDDFETMRDKARSRRLYEKMKHYITKLLPAASAWSDDDFSNDAHIVEQLQNAYGVNLTWCNKNFDPLIHALEKMENDSAYGYLLLGMTDIPMSLATMIWPRDTEKCIEKLFCNACEHIGKYAAFMKERGVEYSEQFVDARQDFQNSWLYHRIAEWYDDDPDGLEQETKTCYFNFSLGIS